MADGTIVKLSAHGHSRLRFHPLEPIVAVMNPGKVSIRDLATGDERPLPEWARGATWIAYGPRGERIALVDASGRFLSVHDDFLSVDSSPAPSGPVRDTAQNLHFHYVLIAALTPVPDVPECPLVRIHVSELVVRTSQIRPPGKLAQ